jgi:hypothetical protein
MIFSNICSTDVHCMGKDLYEATRVLAHYYKLNSLQLAMVKVGLTLPESPKTVDTAVNITKMNPFFCTHG